MRWKQFFTPVKSIDADQARNVIATRSSDDLVILDVRQPAEYERSHIPGAKLIPLPELDDRLAEIDPQKATLVYWAVGGRSRVAAQMLTGEGFDEVYNLSGGINVWESEVAFGKPDQGMALFSGNESLETIFTVAYGLENGLHDFYISMIAKTTNQQVKAVFQKLADIEVKHQQRIFSAYVEFTNKAISLDEFVAGTVSDSMEGGLTTEEYLSRFKPDFDSPIDVLSMAMSIEAQALDLYQRAADNASDAEAKRVLNQIADEERAHLVQLGKTMESV